MEFNKKNIKTLVLVLFGCILFYLGMKNINDVLGGIGDFLGILTPFILGSGIAFVINVPMSKIEHFIFQRTDKLKKSRRGLSFIITLGLVIGIIVIALYIIIPQIAETIQAIAEQLPTAIKSFQSWITLKIESYSALENIAEQLTLNWGDIAAKISKFLQSYASEMVNVGIGAVSNIVSMLVNFLIGFVFAVYILMKKEKLACQGKEVVWAILHESMAEKVLYVCALANKTFSKFISGQCLEACILGTLFFVAMSIMRMPYAMLISVLIAFTALIPMVGAFIGCVVGALLILMVNPTQALVFVIMFLILQQIEGNLIYPHVVGNSVGLPSIWVLVAITLGGKLMGVVGMIVFIPICSVFYAIFRLYIKDRLKVKGISPEKWNEPIKIDESIMTHTPTLDE